MSCCVAYLGVVSSLSLVSVMYVPTQSQLQELDLQNLTWGDNAQTWERLHVTVTLETKKLAKSGCEYGVSLLPVDSDGFPLEIETGQLHELGCATQICAFVDGVKVCDVNENAESDFEVDTVMGKCHMSIPTALAYSTINSKRFVGLNATWLHSGGSSPGNYTCEITHLDDMTLTVTLEPFTAMYDCEDNFFWSHQDEECKPCQNEDILSLCPPGHFVQGCDALAHVGESYCSPCENTPDNFDAGFYAWHPTSECVLECVNNQQYQYFMNGTVCSPCTQSLRTCSEDPENNCCAKTPGKMWQACTSSQNEQCVDCPEILKLQYSQNEVHIPWTFDCESYFIQSFYTLPKEPPYCECQTTCIDNHYRSLTIPNVPCVPCSSGQELLLTAEASAEAGETYKFQQCTKASNTQILQCERKELGCDGIPYSGKVFDLCDVCGGDNTTCIGCDGVSNSGKENDECGICDGDSTTCQGCDGVPNSGLVVDVCNQCGGDNTSCWGCDNISNSGLVFDACGECGGDGSSCWGCDNVSNSGLVFDACGECGGDNVTCTGCDGVLFSGKVFDLCDVCDGDNSSCWGCDNVSNSGTVVDICGVCGGDNTTCVGCDGVYSSTGDVTVFDDCGVCGGANETKDSCGVCYGDNSTCTGCDGVFESGLLNDNCGVCGGDNSTCAGCDNIPNSGKVIDFCGVCGGNNDTCIDCDGVLWQPCVRQPIQVNLARYCGETKDQQCPVSASSYHSFAPPYLATNGVYEQVSGHPAGHDAGGWRSSAGVDTQVNIYLKIDFGQVYTVDYIKVYPWYQWQERVGETEYRVGNSENHRTNSICAQITEKTPNSSPKTLTCGATGRYLFMTKPNTIWTWNEIWVAEIEAYGTVPGPCEYQEMKINDMCGVCGGDNTTCECQIGYTGPQYGNRSDSCVPCGPGTYKDVIGSAACTECGFNTYNPEYGSTSSSACLPCMEHSETEEIYGHESIHACMCVSGYFHDTVTSCTACTPGTFNAEKNRTQCSTCNAGSYSGSSASTTCQLCGSNTYSHEGSALCTNCPGNTESPAGSTLVTNCICKEGYTGPDGGHCQACLAGTYKSATGSDACLACNAGSYSGSTASTTCQLCASNTYSHEGSALCTNCPGNSESPAGSTVVADCICKEGYTGPDGGHCQACSAGTYKSGTGSGACSACASGTYSTSSAATTCLTCQTCASGQYLSSCSGSSAGTCVDCLTEAAKCTGNTYLINCGASYGGACSPCASCLAGEQRNGCTGVSVGLCEACPSGKFKPSTGTEQCQTCPTCSAGKYNIGTCDSINSNTCVDCVAGKYSNVAGLSACLDCQAGKISGSAAATICTTCTEGSTPSADNTTCNGCDNVANSGLVFDSCLECGGDNSTCIGCDGVMWDPLGCKTGKIASQNLARYCGSANDQACAVSASSTRRKDYSYNDVGDRYKPEKAVDGVLRGEPMYVHIQNEEMAQLYGVDVWPDFIYLHGTYWWSSDVCDINNGGTFSSCFTSAPNCEDTYFKLDLGQQYNITRVELFNIDHPDAMHSLDVRVGDNGDDHTANSICAVISNCGGNIVCKDHFVLNCNAFGQYVYLTKQSGCVKHKNIEIVEIEVYGLVPYDCAVKQLDSCGVCGGDGSSCTV